MNKDNFDKNDLKLICECLTAEKKRLAFNAHQWDHAQIGSKSNRDKYFKIVDLIEKIDKSKE